MTTLTSQTQKQIELYADRALAEHERQDVEALLRQNEEARSYLHAIEEIVALSQSAVQLQADPIDFDRLEDAIMAAVEQPLDQISTQVTTHHMLAQWTDQELDNADDIQDVYRHLADHQDARTVVDNLRNIRYATQAYVQHIDATTDYAALEQRCLHATVDPNREAPTALAPVTPFRSWLRKAQAPLTAMVGIAAAAALVLPLSLGYLQGSGASDRMRIDELHVDPGFSGKTSIRKSVPKVWISDEADAEETAPVRKEPKTPEQKNQEDDEPDEQEQPSKVIPKNPK